MQVYDQDVLAPEILQFFLFPNGKTDSTDSICHKYHKNAKISYTPRDLQVSQFAFFPSESSLETLYFLFQE